MLLDKRLLFFHKINNSLSDISGKHSCIEYDNKINKLVINKNIIIEKRIGSPSAIGIINLANIDNNKIVVKIASINKENLEEIKIYKKITNEILLKHKIPHFIFNYSYFTCELRNLNKICPANDKNYKDLCSNFGNSKYYMCINEYIKDGDLFSLIYKEKFNVLKLSFIKNVVAQMIITIYALHYYLKISHNDSHLGNFLYNKIPYTKNDYFHYIINGKDYYLKNKGHILYLNDFGRSSKEKNIANEPIIYRADYELPFLLIKYYLNLEKFKFISIKNLFNLTFNKIYQNEKSFVSEHLDNLMETKIKPTDIIINKNSPYII